MCLNLNVQCTLIEFHRFCPELKKMNSRGCCFTLVLVCACLTFVAGLELGKMKLSRRDSNAGADNPSTCPDEDFDVATLTCRGAAPAPDRQVLTPTDPSPHHKNKDHHGKKKKNSR
ncbi:unnamed protein product [Bemisia tabaci]|uniref:Uncharacterized protein n=1 Tax=Bemisia tabaci TaxID=7038 RepID=A0A9P0A700_BEMTA|nr:unnamed protein product [Bemisia tabaci]